MIKPQILISGYPSLDRIIRVKSHARPGHTAIVTNADNAAVYYGGCSVNIACALAKLGVGAGPVVRVGRDYESSGFKAFLEGAGVYAGAVTRTDGDATSNCYLILDGDNDHVTVFYPGATDEKYFAPLSGDIFDGVRLGVITVGGYKDNLHFYNECRARTIPVVFGMKCDSDAFPSDFLWELLTNSEVVFTNDCERGFIQKKFGLKDISDLSERGRAKIIVTTFGKNGSRYFWRRGDRTERGDVCVVPPRNVADTTGSGDAYIAGFLYGYLGGKGAEECCRYGSTLASFVIESTGALTNIPDVQALENRLRKCFGGAGE
ncbi:MAG: PfkB family carbohydrate kinase [Clostridiales bacterium]|jgi:adenosine kinase|nr:PfkB family carbohydrate kinase [Clostridiales bacterium]